MADLPGEYKGLSPEQFAVKRYKERMDNHCLWYDTTQRLLRNICPANQNEIWPYKKFCPDASKPRKPTMRDMLQSPCGLAMIRNFTYHMTNLRIPLPEDMSIDSVLPFCVIYYQDDGYIRVGFEWCGETCGNALLLGWLVDPHADIIETNGQYWLNYATGPSNDIYEYNFLDPIDEAYNHHVCDTFSEAYRSASEDSSIDDMVSAPNFLNASPAGSEGVYYWEYDNPYI